MENFFNRLKNDFWNVSTAKKNVFIVVFLFLFYHFQNGLMDIVKKYLLSDDDSNFPLFLDFLIVVSFALSIYYFYFKLIKKRYLPSSNEYFLLFIILFILGYLRCNLDYTFYELNNIHKNNYFEIKYIDLPIILIILYFLFNFYRYCFMKINELENSDGSKNKILSDEPITNLDNDELNLSSIVDELYETLLNENHKKSLSIGLVGPWGNGKSSVLNLVEDKITKSDSFKKDDIITIHFLPYLNHKEDDIINEFFLALSNKLSVYNGKLSDDLINYSQKITEFYKDPSITNFLENQISSLTKTSAKELYDSINEMLEEIDKKIIVFVDDLDRLNKNEILQVLKLIRNTADFRNTIFLVAMDKEYVVSRLKISNKILDSRFVDKFFQLEVYLPEIESRILREYFVREIKKPFTNMPIDFNDRVDRTINNGRLLFDDYIKNFRDAKRVINQVRFDLSNFKEDYNYLNLKDFINFTFLKLKFPKMMNDLYDGTVDFLEIDTRTGEYKLIKKNDSSNSSKDIFDMLHVKRKYNIENLNNYKVYDSLNKVYDSLNIEECKEFESINCEDRMLLLKTLAFLFGDENSPVNVDSIRKQNNFRMLMQQRIFSDYYTNHEFEAFLILDKLNIKSSILTLIENKKLNQLVDRLKDYVTDDIAKIKVIINCLTILYENHMGYGVNHVDILPLLSKFVENKKTEPEITSWIKENVFEDKTLTPKTRLELLGHLWDSKYINKLWNLQEKECQTLTKNTFKEYLNQYQDNLWGVDNYEVYGVYHDIKAICHDEINEILKDFWKKNNIETLCAQSTESYGYNAYSFTITDGVNEMFGDRNKFVNFIKEHPDKEITAIKEFLKLYELLQIVNFSKYIFFEFKESKKMLAKIEDIQSKSKRVKEDKVIRKREIFFETNYLEFIDKIMANVNYFEGVNLMGFKFNDKGYLSVIIDESLGLDGLTSFISRLQLNSKILKIDDYKFKMSEDIHAQEFNFILMDKYYFKSISIQPPFKNNTPN